MRIRKVKEKKVHELKDKKQKEIKSNDEQGEDEQEEQQDEQEFSSNGNFSTRERTAPVLQAGQGEQSNLERTAQSARTSGSGTGGEEIKYDAQKYTAGDYSDSKYQTQEFKPISLQQEQQKEEMRNMLSRKMQQSMHGQAQIQEAWRERTQESQEPRTKYETATDRTKTSQIKRRRD